jgi:hypothetical protein
MAEPKIPRNRPEIDTAYEEKFRKKVDGTNRKYIRKGITIPPRRIMKKPITINQTGFVIIPTYTANMQ